MKKLISRNALTFTGRLVEDAQMYNNDSTARFRLAHNFGGETKDGEPKATLFIDCVMFTAKGTVHEKEIPAGLLKKGTSVEIQGSLRPNVRESNGKSYTVTEILVASVSEASYKEVEDPQEKPAQETQEAPREAQQEETPAEAPAAEDKPKKAPKKGRKAAAKAE